MTANHLELVHSTSLSTARKGAGSFDPTADTIKVLTMHTSKGLEFPLVALVGAGHMPAPGEDEREETKPFYVGATRAAQRLIVGLSGGAVCDAIYGLSFSN